MRTFLIMVVLLSIQTAHAGDMYRWVDKQGRVHYSDMQNGEEADKLDFKKFGKEAASGTAETNLPYQTREAMKNYPVTLYTAPSCTAPCKEARDFLNKRHIPFTEKALQSPEEVDAFKEKSGISTVPTISVGKDWLQGFQAQQWQDELDAVGYPK